MNRKNIAMFRNAMVFCLLSISFVCAYGLQYPPTERIDCVNVYHGVEVCDAYRWLEEDVRQSAKVNDWVEAQNKLTFDYLHSIDRRGKIKHRLTELWDYEKFSTPSKKGGRYFISKNDGLQNHYVVYVSDTLDGKRKVLLDPNKWSEDGTVSLSGISVSNDGKYAAYGIQESGSDWRTWKVRDIKTGKDTPDVLNYLKFTRPIWDADSKGFFYGKYPDPKPGQEFTSPNKNMKLMYHRLGTNVSEDTVIYYRNDKPDWVFWPYVTDDGKYLIVTISVTTDDKYRVLYKDLTNPYTMGMDLITEFENEYTFIGNDGSVFYFKTDYNAKNGRLIAIDIDNPHRKNWKEIIPESTEPLQWVNRVGGKFVCGYMKDVCSEIQLFETDGTSAGKIRLPSIGTARGFSGKNDHTETFYSFQSYSIAPSIYHYDFATGKSNLIERDGIDYTADDFVTTQKFYKSKDGTRVPIFITHKKGIKFDGSNPTILYGYGGFNISIQPRFSASRVVWMEMGGIYAVANIRGGGEYGQLWHESGKKTAKQNVFDDFIAAAEWLINNNYTSNKKLAIWGGSNGGLLVGACITQRPELFAAAIPAVGVMDMLRFDEFTAGRFWTDEFGSAKDSPEMFKYLLGYSPYHNIKEDTAYPATLIITAETDDRVVPSHSFKFAARIQQCHKGQNPVLIRIQRKAGHGSGKPTSMQIDETADIYAFLAENLEMRKTKRDQTLF